MARVVRAAAILFFSTLCVCTGCDVDDVAVYKVQLTTLWSEKRFPKDYPNLYRPKAQWSQLFGVSHNASFTLYHVGSVASDAVRHFAQFGDLATLVQGLRDSAEVYDEFSAPPIANGEGSTENVVLVDGGHSLVSLLSRMIPSPDWFVGVDSVNLCVDDAWIEEITLDLDPLDAGAASGLTFTAPRYETKPPAAVSRHRPKHPNHPAAGFYYPGTEELPAIAKVTFTKVREYTTIELNDLARKEFMNKLIAKDKFKDMPRGRTERRKQEEFSTKGYSDQLKDLEEDAVGTPEPGNPDNNVEVVMKTTTTSTSTTTTTQKPATTTTEAEFDPSLHSMDDVVLAVARGRRLGLKGKLPRHFRSRLHHAVNKVTENDCLVSDWGAWSPCSVTCGFGEKFRYRKILRQPKGNGRDCPSLKNRQHCGNVNSCYNVDYFQW